MLYIFLFRRNPLEHLLNTSSYRHVSDSEVRIYFADERGRMSTRRLQNGLELGAPPPARSEFWFAQVYDHPPLADPEGLAAFFGTRGIYHRGHFLMLAFTTPHGPIEARRLASVHRYEGVRLHVSLELSSETAADLVPQHLRLGPTWNRPHNRFNDIYPVENVPRDVVANLSTISRGLTEVQAEQVLRDFNWDVDAAAEAVLSEDFEPPAVIESSLRRPGIPTPQQQKEIVKRLNEEGWLKKCSRSQLLSIECFLFMQKTRLTFP